MLGGKYRVERVLGEGGMGIVLSAVHVGLEELRAIKLMRPEIAEDRAAVHRFKREARIAARLTSEHIARVHDLDELPNGQPYIVLEHLAGEDLARRHARQAKLPAAQAALYMRQACEGLSEAHAAGLVHRDIKPGNLFLTRRGDRPWIKVLDFGIAKALSGCASLGRITASGDVLGTLRYMAPEQMEARRDVDTRADVWSIGAVLYQLITGVPPFPERALLELLGGAAHGGAPLPTPSFTLVPRPLADLILRCLTVDRHLRPANGAELANELARFAGG
jgi:serine/threonine-protein kinase